MYTCVCVCVVRGKWCRIWDDTQRRRRQLLDLAGEAGLNAMLAAKSDLLFYSISSLLMAIPIVGLPRLLEMTRTGGLTAMLDAITGEQAQQRVAHATAGARATSSEAAAAPRAASRISGSTSTLIQGRTTGSRPSNSGTRGMG